jgi:hypothetical protein
MSDGIIRLGSKSRIVLLYEVSAIAAISLTALGIAPLNGSENNTYWR